MSEGQHGYSSIIEKVEWEGGIGEAIDYGMNPDAPRTEAGKRFVTDDSFGNGGTPEARRKIALAIEAEMAMLVAGAITAEARDSRPVATADLRAALAALCSYVEDATARQQIVPTSDITRALNDAREALTRSDKPTQSDLSVAWERLTRFEVIDHRTKGEGGRVFTAWQCRVEPSVQDEGRTLKVFLADQLSKEGDASRFMTGPLRGKAWPKEGDTDAS